MVKDFIKKHGDALKSVGSSAIVALLVTGLLGYKQAAEAKRSADAAKRSADAAEATLKLAQEQAAAGKKRDRATVSDDIWNVYKDIRRRADHDCVIASWLEEQCKYPETPKTTDGQREEWMSDLLRWMEIVYVQTEALDANSASAWRANVRSYLDHPEICRRVKTRLEGNEQYWEDVFWEKVPSNCKGPPTTASQGSAALAPYSPDTLKAKFAVPRDDASAPK